MFVIEDNIPPPRAGGSSPERQALDELQVGQSILFPAGDSARTAINAATNKRGKDKSWKFTQERQSDGSVRIWRLT
jgi:hypothetical protein